MASAVLPEPAAAALGFKCSVCRGVLVAPDTTSPTLDEVERRIVDSYPILIALPFRNLIEQADIVRKCRILVDVLTNTLKYLALVVETEYLRSDLRDEALNGLVDDLGRPLVSAWHRFLRAALPFMEQAGHIPFIPELKAFYEKVELQPARRNMVKPPGSYYNDLGEQVAKKSDGLGWVSALIYYRNRFDHDPNLPDDELQILYDFYYPVLKGLLAEMALAGTNQRRGSNLECCGTPPSLNVEFRGLMDAA